MQISIQSIFFFYYFIKHEPLYIEIIFFLQENSAQPIQKISRLANRTLGFSVSYLVKFLCVDKKKQGINKQNYVVFKAIAIISIVFVCKPIDTLI